MKNEERDARRFICRRTLNSKLRKKAFRLAFITEIDIEGVVEKWGTYAKHGLDLACNRTNKDGQTLLHWVAGLNPNLEVVKHLIERGANVHAKDKYGMTPLHWAADNNSNVEVVKYLLEHGANPREKGAYGTTPIICAARWNPVIGVIESLFEQGIDIDEVEEDSGHTLLHWAAKSNPNIAVLKYLVETGANIELKNGYGNTPLHSAAINSLGMKKELNFAAVRYLVEIGADVNERNHDGLTPLCCAKRSPVVNTKVVEYLTSLKLAKHNTFLKTVMDIFQE